MRNLFLIIILFPIAIYAQNGTNEMVKKGIDITKNVPKGLKVGDKAPIIRGLTINGRVINSNEILKDKNIVLIFYRGKWCPVCNRYLSNLNDSIRYIKENNTEIIVVGPESPVNAEKMADKTNANFLIIPDTSLQILKDYDVLFYVTKKYQRKIKTFLLVDIAKNNEQKEAALPIPATYIIGKNGIIKWRQFNYDYSKRATVKAIIEALN